MVAAQEYEQLGLRPGDNQTHLKEAGEKLCSSTQGYDNTQTQQEAVSEDGAVPLSAPPERGAG